MSQRSVLVSIGIWAIGGMSALGQQCADFSTWFNDGCPESSPGWTIEGGGTAVRVTNNVNDAAYWINDFDIMNRRVSTSIEVDGLGGNDFFGFAIGLDDGEWDNKDARYLLVVWRGGAQGLELLDVNGSLRPAAPCPRFGSGGNDIIPPYGGPVAFVVDASSLGSTQWNHQQTYTFEIVLADSRLRIYVDGSLEFDIAPPDIQPGAVSFSSLLEGGGFAFFNSSQPDAVYSQPCIVGGIPTVTTWGIVALVLCVLVTGTVVFRRRAVA